MSNSTKDRPSAAKASVAEICARPLRPFEYLEIKPKPGRHRALRDANALFVDGFELQGNRLPSIASPVDWSFGPRSFNFHLHAFLPLNALLSAYDATSDTEYLTASIDFALDWIDANMAHIETPFPDDIADQCLAEDSGNRWYDMAIGQRLYKFAYMLDAGARQEIDRPDWFAKIAGAIQLHHLLLKDERIFQNHNNHGFYQAINQYAAATRLPELDDAKYAELSRSRLVEMIDRQFCSDGIQIEHSPGYHHMVTTTLINARNAGMLDKPLVRKIARLEHNHSLFIKPDGRIATIGDTDPRNFWDETQFAGLFEDPAMQYIVSGGTRGDAPETGVTAMVPSGYAIARLSPEDDRTTDFSEQSYLIQHAGFHSRTHKHADHLSFVWQEAGRDILTDPGRYGYVGKVEPGTELYEQGFFYSAPERVYCESTRAHNCVEIDGRSYPRRNVKPWGSALLQAEQQDGLAVFNASVPHMRTVSHRRSLILRPGHFLLVIDWLRDRETERDFRQWFCFDPAWHVGLGEDEIRAVSPSEDEDEFREIVAVSLAEDSVPETVASGESDPELLGWLSDRANHLTPATSVSFATPKGEFGRFATLFVLSPYVEPDRAAIRFNSSMRAGRAVWRDDRGVHRVDLATEEDGRIVASYHPVSTSKIGTTEVNVVTFRAEVAKNPLAPIAAIEHQPLPSLDELKARIDDALSHGWHLGGLDIGNLEPPIDFDKGERSERYLRHSWAPVGPLLILADRLGERSYRDVARRYAMDWLERFERPHLETSADEFVDQLLFGGEEDEEENFAWYDMGVGQRAHLIAYLLDALARDENVPDDEVALLYDALTKHLALLGEAGFQLHHSNHGLYQSLGRYAAAHRFARHPPFADHIDAAREDFRKIVRSQFFTDGMHAEHSPGYQLKILQTLLGAREAGLLEDESDIDELLDKGVHALGWLVTPSGGLATIGDTDPGDWRDQPGLVKWPDPKLAGLFAGKNSKDYAGAMAFTESGYAVVREKGSHLVQACGFHSRVHKHADDMSFVWQEGDLPIFIDPGRFEYRGRTARSDPQFDQGFWYADERRQYVESTRAHNCVEIDGRNFDRMAERRPGSFLKEVIPAGNAHAILSERIHFDAIIHRRVLVLEPGQWLAVLDWLDDDNSKTHDYRQFFQLAPEWKARGISGGYSATADDPTLTVTDLLGNTEASPVLRGRKTPFLQGWTAPGEQRFEPAPSLCFVQSGTQSASFATLAMLGDKPSGPTAVLSDGNEISLNWTSGKKQIHLSLSRRAFSVDVKS